ncbi:hypothetical protein ABE426_06550 [Sphingobacterium faecium]|uniref:AbiU2 domain-containing protein n=1 Tax=Sphingobacterium faecium TaxID=34087 RepID=UPI0032092A3A
MNNQSNLLLNDKSDTSELSSKKANLKLEVKAISGILLQAKESLKIVEYLVKGNLELDVYNRGGNDFWRFTTEIYSDHVLLKLNILFTPKEHFSIAGLVKNLKTDGLFSGLIDISIIEQWEQQITKLRSTFKKIKIHRNKRIAHQDRKISKIAKVSFSFIELNTIVLLVQDVVQNIYSEVFESSYRFETIGSPVESLEVIMNVLDKERRAELAPLFEECRKNGLNDELPLSERM